MQKKKTASRKVDSDEESFVEAESSSESSEDDLEADMSDSAVSSEEKKPPAKKPRAKGKKASNKGPSMAEGFKPMNTPSYKKMSLDQIYKEKEFLDPCGMGGTDDIVDRLVGEQVDKIGLLLQRSLQNGGVGSFVNPLQLGTAWSGTDAPSLALTLVEEQMELRGLGSLFNFSHKFSCENDPFKQGKKLNSVGSLSLLLLFT